VLEVGTGSGYAAAVLSLLAATVDTVERLPGLADTAAERLERLGFDNVSVHRGDGSRGWPANAPYDGICVAAAAPDVPDALLDQLDDGGRLVLPIGPLTSAQRLVRVRREGGGWVEDPLGEVRFVPLVGEEGWDGDDTGSS
jgi:protein-L-isoaspartate(D-aspartate) O-methyltransferase